MRGYTYLIYNPKTFLTKIGFSIHPDARAKYLRGEYKQPKLAIVGLIKGSFERIMHYWFNKQRDFGEWFSFSQGEIQKILKDVNRISDAYFEARIASEGKKRSFERVFTETLYGLTPKEWR